MSGVAFGSASTPFPSAPASGVGFNTFSMLVPTMSLIGFNPFANQVAVALPSGLTTSGANFNTFTTPIPAALSGFSTAQSGFATGQSGFSTSQSGFPTQPSAFPATPPLFSANSTTPTPGTVTSGFNQYTAGYYFPNPYNGGFIRSNPVLNVPARTANMGVVGSTSHGTTVGRH